jgi:hypothetical protein
MLKNKPLMHLRIVGMISSTVLRPARQTAGEDEKIANMQRKFRSPYEKAANEGFTQA